MTGEIFKDATSPNSDPRYNKRERIPTVLGRLGSRYFFWPAAEQLTSTIKTGERSGFMAYAHATVYDDGLKLVVDSKALFSDDRARTIVDATRDENYGQLVFISAERTEWQADDEIAAILKGQMAVNEDYRGDLPQHRILRALLSAPRQHPAEQ